MLNLDAQTGALTTTINGTVLDSLSKQPIEYATITVQSSLNKKTITGTTSNNKGFFEITGLTPGSYILVIEFIGYQAFTTRELVLVKKNDLLSLNQINLLKSQHQLQAVTVKSQSRLIENKIDKMVFNAEKDLTSQGGVATDVLKKVPQVSVDVDGNVELSGSSSIRFLINGKPSTAFGSSIADVLQAIPASQIKSIEVITNPGAKYDAEGLGGIINIILKQTKAKGMNVNLSLTAGTRMENGSLNMNIRNGNLGINAFISGNGRLPSNTPVSLDRTSLDTFAKTTEYLRQDGSNTFTRHGIESGVGFDWTYKQKNNFSGSIGFDEFGNNAHGFSNQLQQILSGTGEMISAVSSLNKSSNSFRFRTIDASLNYKRTFTKEDQGLEIGVNSSFGNNHISATNEQYLEPADSLYYGRQNTNPGTSRETEINIDYTQPLAKDVVLGVGSKLTLMNISSTSDVLSLQPDAKVYIRDSFLSNYLDYQQQVYAAYAEISFPVSNWFDTKIGSRYERTAINSYYSNAQSHAGTPGYNTFVPSIFFSKKLKDGQTIKLSYSRRIQRPDYRSLNPFINTSDPKNITAGNPYLQPEIGNRIELGYNADIDKLGSFMVNLFYRSSDHDIQPYVVYYPTLTVGDTTYHNVSVSTQQNIGLEKNIGVNIFGDIHASPKLTIRTNLFFFKRYIINALDPGYNAQSFNYRLNLNAAYQFSPTLAAEFFGNFNSARNEVQGKYPSFTTYSFAIRKQFWNKKGSLALMANNPFSEYVNQRTSLFGPNFSTNSIRKVPFRSIGINFTWKFGKLEFKKEKEENGGGNPPTE